MNVLLMNVLLAARGVEAATYALVATPGIAVGQLAVFRIEPDHGAGSAFRAGSRRQFPIYGSSAMAVSAEARRAKAKSAGNAKSA